MVFAGKSTYGKFLQKLIEYNLAYLHIAGPAEDLLGKPAAVLQDNYFNHFRKNYRGQLMANLGFTQDSANAILQECLADSLLRKEKPRSYIVLATSELLFSIL